MADHVTMISRGTIALSAPLNAIKQSHRCVTVRFGESRAEPPALAGALSWQGEGREWSLLYRDCDGSEELQAAVAGWEARIVTERVPSLDEIFVAHVGSPATSTATSTSTSALDA